MRQYLSMIRGVFLIGISLILHTLSAQEGFRGKVLLDQYIEAEQIDEAATTLEGILEEFNSIGAVDSLYHYPYYVGKIERLRGDLSKALQKMEAFVTDMEKRNASQKSRYLAKMSMSEFYDEVSENKKSFDVTEQALTHVLRAENVTQEEVGKIRYNLGASYLALDDIPNAKKQFQEALVDYKAYTKTSKKRLSDGYNAMGAIMWLSTKLDSAKYYYKKASETIKIAEGDSIENLHYATVIQSNVSLLEYAQGNMSKALEIQNNVIKSYEKVIQEIGNPEFKARAQRFQARAISNLSTFYNEMGNLTRANEIVRYAYAKKKLFMEPTDDDLASTLIQIGQSELSLRSYEEAVISLKRGLKIFEDKGAIRPYWKGAAYNALARVYEQLGKSDSAAYYYEIALPLFDKALGDNIDAEYLSFLKNKAEFESSEGYRNEAITTAQKAYDYVATQGGEDSFEVSKQMLSLAKVYLNLKEYDKAEYWSTKGDSLLQEKTALAKTTVNTIKIDFNRPLLLLVKAKSAYKNLDRIDVNALLNIRKELNSAVTILERRKEIAFTPEDINQLLSEYKEINDFSKRLNLELYKTTVAPEYLSALMTVQESGMYNRIRAKLNNQHSVTFFGVPQKVLEEEKRKKEALSTSLAADETVTVLSYFDAEKDWRNYLDTLKREYPEYYKMRYATIEIPVDQIVNEIPKDVTVIRYFFIENELYAFVANRGEQQLIALDTVEYEQLNKTISEIADNQFDVTPFLGDLHHLYTQLWEPLLESNLKEDVIIIPDGPLYNLSFEMLTSSVLTDYSEFAKKSILTRHNIAYNYSLLLIENKTTNTLQDNFIAFTPEFSEKMKDDYKIGIKDSLDVDHTYLTLLPQPFSVSIAEDYTRTFKGDHFKNVNATKQLFIEQAGEHKIIHIGTHAESNNISPELSRLIFAKRVSGEQSLEDNSLYTYEIYNCNLSANLAILTACETGKPGYQSGEGMISLAHAFNYAGSESILTSLWKIDEQSSAEIVSYFYDNLKEGKRKDLALKEAKLKYLSTAQGRTLQPNYWAGLVLMGDVAPLEIASGIIWWKYVLLSIIVLSLFFLIRNRMSKVG